MRLRPVLSCALLVAAAAIGLSAGEQPGRTKAPLLGSRTVAALKVDGLTFKDLNKNGRLDPYEDWRAPIESRVNDLVGQMTLEEKAGFMVSPTLPMGPDGALVEKTESLDGAFGRTTQLGTSDAVLARHIRQFIVRVNTPPRTMATWLNRVQEVAERSRLGIPAFFVTNPRNHLGSAGIVGIDEAGASFSQWPGTLGLAATRDAALVEEFSRIAAQEYVSVGLRGAYHPQADLATEPRWARISGTLGEDADLASDLLRAMVRGFQGTALGPASVALIVKHFPGGGPAIEGQDSHFAYGKYDVYPGGNFDYHVRPFKAAIDAGAAIIMPYYSIPKGITKEEVGNAFNREIITDLLRGRLAFTGVVNSDSGITTSMAWGVEGLTVEQRYRRAIEAGTDIFSNDTTPEYVVNLVRNGEVPERRIDESVRRMLRIRFALGIFENPYADPEHAANVVNNAEFRTKALTAQRKSIVVLTNGKNILPLKAGTKVYLEGVDPVALAASGLSAVATPAGADVCLVRLTRAGGSGEAGGRGGRSGGRSAGRSGGAGGLNTGGVPIDLTFSAEELATVRPLMQLKPTVTVIYMDRPYVIPEIARESAALVAHFGVTDQALLDVLTGAFAPVGRMPFELPSSMEAVRAQKEDVPRDSPNPLFAFGHGLTYAARTRR
jgi:beta-glucosidase